MKKIIIVLLVAVAGFFLYDKRDFFRTRDSFEFVNTPESIKAKVQVYAFLNNPSKVEYKDGKWISDDGSQAIVVYNGSENFGLPKRYKHADFYVNIGEDFFCKDFAIDKENTAEPFDIKFTVEQAGSNYFIKGNVLYEARTKISFQGSQMSKLSKRVEVTYYRDEGKTKTQWFDH